MKLHRRKFLHLAAGAAAFSAVPRIANADTYPSRPVRILVGFPAGGLSDIVARLIAQRLSEQFGQQFVVENRPGAVTNIATQEVVRAAPDGYTLLLATPLNAINATVYDNLTFNFIHDVAPIAGMVDAAFVLEVNPSVPAKTVPELIAYAKANPGKLKMASAGIGSPEQIAGELFKMMTDIDMLHVPYRGSGPYLIDLVGGQVQVVFGPLASSIQYIEAGTLRALAVTTATRSQALPDLPTIGDYLPGFAISGWQGLGAPKNTPKEIVNLLNKAVNTALADPGVKARCTDLGLTVLPGSPADFETRIAEDTEKWAKVVKFAGIKAE
jgi:tripartite-type tricarboxylate transporter receptor subunit TctC